MMETYCLGSWIWDGEHIFLPGANLFDYYSFGCAASHNEQLSSKFGEPAEYEISTYYDPYMTQATQKTELIFFHVYHHSYKKDLAH